MPCCAIIALIFLIVKKILCALIFVCKHRGISSYAAFFLLQSSGVVEGEFARRNPLKQAKLRRSRSITDPVKRRGSQSHTRSRSRSRSISHISRASNHVVRQMTEFGFNPGVGGSPRRSVRETSVSFVDERDGEVMVRRKSSVRVTRPVSQEYSREKEYIEVEMTDALKNQMAST